MSTNRRIFVRQLSTGAIGFCFLPSFLSCKSEHKSPLEEPLPPLSNGSLPRSTPEAQGISSETILNLIDEIEKSEIQFHSLMIVRNGHVVAEGWWYPYQPQLEHQLYSLSKSFTSTAVGIAVKEGKLTVEDKVISFFPNDLPDEVTPYLAQMRVKNLLTMAVGHDTDTTNLLRNDEGTTWVKKFLSLPIAYEPGSVFLYNSGATFMLSAILQKITGEKVVDYLKPRLFEPLHIEGMDWLENPQGINTGGYGLRVKTEDIAKLGQLYLQNGKWDGKEILTEDYVKAATSKQIDSKGSNPNDPPITDWSSGYGYQFWMSTPGGFRADGAFGQFSLVNREHNTVVAITEQSFDTQKSMKLIWDHFYPELKVGQMSENEEAVTELESKLENLKIAVPQLQLASPLAKEISGKTYVFKENTMGVKSIQLWFEEENCSMILEEDKGNITLNCGMNHWVIGDNEKKIAESFFYIPGGIVFPSKIAASATWQDDKTLLVDWQFIETVHGDHITCNFEGDSINISFMGSMAKGSARKDARDYITGTLKS